MTLTKHHRLRLHGCPPSGDYFDENAERASREWQNSESHFDNVGSSIAAVMRIVTLDDWKTLLYDAVDAVGPGKAPQKEASMEYSLYFVLSMVVGPLFCLPFLVAQMVTQMVELRKTGLYLMSPAQLHWYFQIKALHPNLALTLLPDQAISLK